MAVALEAVVKQLEDSGIVAAGKLKDLIPPRATPKDGEALLRELFKRNLVTKFQAQQVAAGRAKSLILGNYTLLDKIGAGGMGQVFKAEHRRLKRVVAIKTLPAATLKDAAAVARFQREVEAAAKLRHPNIVATDDADEANGIHFLVMEYVQGNDLSALVKKEGPLSVAKGINCVLQAARGLEFAHKSGVIHRDIKPGNLLLGSDGVVKILDMGLARIESGGDAATQAELTGTGAVMGTVDYMAPEQARNTHKADARADIYSLGCTLHYLLMAKPVYEAESITSKLIAHQFDPIPSLGNKRDDVSEEMQAVFEKMVAKKVEERYQSMTEVVAELEKVSGDQATSFSIQHTVKTNLDNSALTFLKNIPPAQTIYKQKAADHSATAGAKPEHAGNAKNRKVKTQKAIWIAAGTMGFLSAVCALFAVIIVIRNQKGEEIRRIELPAGQTAELLEVTPKPALLPQVTSKAEIGKRITTFGDPAFQSWMKDVVALPAEKQLDAVAKKLVELNTGFDGKVTGGVGWSGGVPKIENGVVTEFGFITDNVTDISPVRALPGLKALRCSGGSGPKTNGLSDLSPLRGLSLTHLSCRHSARVSNLSPLQGMALNSLDIYGTQVSDLSPLKGMPLTMLDCHGVPILDLSPLRETKVTNLGFGGTKISDLSALRGMPLTSLAFSTTKISDLTPLKGMPLTSLTLFATPVADLSPLKGMPLTSLSCEGTLVSDLSPLEGMPLKTLNCDRTNVSDLQPLKGTPLTNLTIPGTKVSDLSPLKGMKLTNLVCNDTLISDLSPLQGMSVTNLSCNKLKLTSLSALKGMPLKSLDCSETRITDLSPLQGMPLTTLNCQRTSVSDLSPLKGMKLASLDFFGTPVSDLSSLVGMPLVSLNCRATAVSDVTPLAGMTTLGSLDLGLTKAAASEIAALQKALPNCKIVRPITTLSDPVFQRWMTETAALSAEKQIEAVAKKLQALNPGFDGRLSGANGNGMPKLENGAVTELGLLTNQVTDISPVRTLNGLKILKCDANAGKDALFDLSPLAGMQLASLSFSGTKVSDLSPLTGMPLTKLFFRFSQVTDLAPISGMMLTDLDIGGSQVSNFSPLQGMPLKFLDCYAAPVSDLSPLRGMPLSFLRCDSTPVSELTPLNGMKLEELFFRKTNAADLSPLKALPLWRLDLESTPVSDLSPLQDCKKLKELRIRQTKVTAADVAALQKALPACKIDWDDPAKFGKP